MKKLILMLLFFSGIMAHGQSPQLNVKGQDSIKVKMSQLKVSVKVVGNIAYTVAEMHFNNASNRQMEGELLFPLPEGVSVSRYAIDINGKIREAVPVNKNKGKQVFEAVEHRRVDPGLLEKVEGNNFRTRIYPILPNKERIVIIGYEQELVQFDANNLAYQLVSRYPKKLDQFELKIAIIGAVSKPSILNETTELSLGTPEATSWNQTYQATISRENYQPSEKLLIKIPNQSEIPSVVVQSKGSQHYFYANTLIAGTQMKKKNPKSVGVLWDNSLSCKNRDVKKELHLLDLYFTQLKNVEVTLYFVGYNFEKKAAYPIVNGNWEALKLQLQNAQYDGGTRFSKIKLPSHDEYLFFTDGLSSLSENQLENTKKPIYTITSIPSSDYAFLNYNAIKTGGSFINLNQLSAENSLDKLVYQNLKFLGVKDNYFVTELFPMIGTPVSGSFSVAGISLQSKNDVVLLFGYDGTPTVERKITIDASSQSNSEVNIEKLWAQEKIANLEIQYKQNADEIESLGKRYGIITQNTSLIVLENINDYIQYDIIPPTELREEFDRIQKQQRKNMIAKTHNNWENIDNYFTQLKLWWNSDIKYSMPKPVPVDKPKRVVTTVPRNSNSKFIQGLVSDTSGPIPGANVVIKGTRTGTQTDVDGRYSIDAKAGDILNFSYIGMHDASIKVGASKLINCVLRNSGMQLDEVEITGAMGIKKSKDATTRTETILENELFKEASPNTIQTLSGKISGIQISEDSPINVDKAGYVNPVVTQISEMKSDSIPETEFQNGRYRNEKTKVNQWNPDRIYLKVLAGAPIDKKYGLYLQLRADQINNPNFYFDVANHFYDAGDTQKALLILSNIADLGLENHQLYKSLTYQLRQWEANEDALFTATQVAKWRVQEPQAHRDLGLTLEDNKHYQAGFDELIKALEINYFGEMSGQYEGVEDIILMDLKRMLSEHKSINATKFDKKYQTKMPVAVRIILNWNQMDTDIDLHVVEPTGEECYYGHRDTKAGARFSKDFTQGYGPEQYLLRNIVKGKFEIKTNFYGESALTENGPTTVMVEIYTTNKNGKTERKLQTIQLGKVKQNENLAVIALE